MKKEIIKLFMRKNDVYEINIVPDFNKFLYDNEFGISFTEEEQCMNYIMNMDTEDFICLCITLFAKIGEYNKDDEDAMIRTVCNFIE